MIKVGDKIDGQVIRGPESWTYIYIALGFAITIESTRIRHGPLLSVQSNRLRLTRYRYGVVVPWVGVVPKQADRPQVSV
jgi:hypothetical protein